MALRNSNFKESLIDFLEADSQMFYHLLLVAAPSNVVMRTNDTFSLVIAIECKQFYDTSLKLWLENGTQSKNTIRYICIDQAYEKFVKKLYGGSSYWSRK